jgi:hypothetical protein
MFVKGQSHARGVGGVGFTGQVQVSNIIDCYATMIVVQYFNLNLATNKTNDILLIISLVITHCCPLITESAQ